MNEPTNEDRKKWITKTLDAFCTAVDNRMFKGEETDITDLLADLMHFCHSDEIDFKSRLRMAENHFIEEMEEEKP